MPTYCWLGGARCDFPLSLTDTRKWQTLAALAAELCVIGFAPGLRPRAFRAEGARFYLLPAPSVGILRHALFFTLGTLLALWLVLRRRQPVDVFIAQSPYEGAVGALAKNVARLFGRRVRLVVESHGDFEVSLFMQRRIPLAGVYRALMRAFARCALRHADALRAVSSTSEAQLRQYRADLPLVNFMAWTDAQAFADAGARRPAPPSASRVVMYAGVQIPRKNVHRLIDAFARAAPPDAQLWLVGKAENPDYAAQLRAQVAQSALAARITFVDAVPQTELAARMAQARVLVLPSSSEGLGRVLVEAMTCGTPALGARVGGIPDVVRAGDNGWLVPPDDTDALAGALAHVFALPAAELDAIGARARAFALDFFSPQTYLDGHRRLLEHVR